MKFLKLVLIAVFAIFSLACFLLLILQRDWTAYNISSDFPRIESITIVRNYALIHFVAFASALILLSLALVSLYFKKLPFRPALWLLPLVLYPISFTKSVVSNLGPWTYHGTAEDPSGNIYRFLDSSFLQGQMMVIGRLKERNMFTDKFDVLAETNGDYPRRYLHIVRPADAQEGYGLLYLTADNWLVGLRYENRMFLAYDLNSHKPFERDDVLDLSPFLLIDQNTQLHQADSEQLLGVGIGENVGQPRRNAVVASLQHGNPSVRTLASKLLELKKAGQSADAAGFSSPP